MRICGFIDSNWDGWATIDGIPFAESMYEFAQLHGIAYKHGEGLGGKRAAIKNCKIMMYTSKKETTFKEAQEKFIYAMFSAYGVYEMDSNYVGYSEWTITGFDLAKCKLGGHDLNQILLSHKGEYANIEVEC